MSRRSRSRSPLNGTSRSSLRSRSPLARETRVVNDPNAESSHAAEASPANDSPAIVTTKPSPGRWRRRGEPYTEEQAARVRALLAENLRKLNPEIERRRNLGIEGRLREDGNNRVRRWKAQGFLVFLEVTPVHNNRASCRAAENCLVKHSREQSGTQGQLLESDQSPWAITDAYRIGVGPDRLGRRREFYHVVCFNKMTDLASLTPDWFVLCNLHNQWGVMFREWFRHKGQINLAKIAEYIDAENEYQRIINSPPFVIDDSTMHLHRPDKTRTCVRPEKPVLAGHTMGPEEGCSILDVIDNPRNAELGEWVQRETEKSHIFFPGGGGMWKLAIS